MSALAAAGAFVLGAWLSVRTLAALYAVIDLRYAPGRHRGRIARGILGWGGAAGAAALVLPGGLRTAFLAGFTGYVLFYVAAAGFLAHVVMPRVVRGARRARRAAEG